MNLDEVTAREYLEPIVPPVLRFFAGKGRVGIGLKVHHYYLRLAARDAWAGGPQQLMASIPAEAIPDLITRLRQLQREAEVYTLALAKLKAHGIVGSDATTALDRIWAETPTLDVGDPETVFERYGTDVGRAALILAERGAA